MIVYATSIWNHYQGPLCYEMARQLGADHFRAIMVRPEGDVQTQRRVKLGWDVKPPKEMWIVPNPKTQDELDAADSVWAKYIEDSEVVVLSALHFSRRLGEAVRKRIRSGKLTFIINERFFKEKITVRDCLNPVNWYRWAKLHFKYNYKNVHYLPISHFGSDDLKWLHTCKGRMWQWAYFPEISKTLCEKPKNEKLQIGWCGRYLGWKHVEVAIKAIASLPADVRNRCELHLVGSGVKEEELKQLVKDLALESCVTFEPPKTVPEIAEFMRRLDVYLLPSDRGEGWGVVIAEAMNKGCVPIACEEAGVTLELVQDGVNGIVHRNGDISAVANRIACLCRDREQLNAMSMAAFETTLAWSAEEAVKRLIVLIKQVRSGGDSPFNSGLCRKVG